MYGVALASEYSWNASRNVDADDFEGRYCMVRFGSEDTMFVQALNAESSHDVYNTPCAPAL